MNLHFSFKADAAKTPDVERDLQLHAQKLGRFLSAYRPDLVHLHGTIDHLARAGYAVSLNLRLPTGQLAAQEEGQALQPAIKVAFAELTSQLKRHKQLIRNEHRWRRGRRPERGPVAELQETVERAVRGRSAPPRKPAVSSNHHDSSISAEVFESASLFQSDVRQYISGNLDRLQSFVERELRYREDNGELPRGSVSAPEVMDEVVVSALSAEQAPEGFATERWIYRLALDSIQRLESENGNGVDDLPLEEPVGTPNVQATDDDLLQYRQPGESHNREDFLRTSDSTNPEDEAAQDEMVEQIESALRGAHADERHAFVLYTIEGFTLLEIARVMERNYEHVKQLIQSAREQVIKRLPPSNALKQRLLEHSDVA